MNLFSENKKTELILPDTSLDWYPNFFDEKEANSLFIALQNTINWQQKEVLIFGKKIAQPRLTELHGDEGLSYTYSGLKWQTNPWNKTTLYIKEKIEKETGASFNSCLLNLYRNEEDSNGWHADNEKELGKDPIIASVSFGASRIFSLKHNSKKEIKKQLELSHGSLLLMNKGAQLHYKHQIAKTTQPKDVRINLTFRYIH